MIIRRSKAGKKLARPYEMPIQEVLKKDAMLFINNIPVISKRQAKRKITNIIVNSKDPSTIYPGYIDDLQCRINELEN